MPNPTRHFFIGNQHYGSCEAPTEIWMGGLAPAISYIYLCPCCGDSWARAIIEGRAFQVWERPCRKHSRSRSDVPGSLWLDWAPRYTSRFPIELLQWELERHADWAESRADS